MKTTKAAKHDRRTHRKDKDRRRHRADASLQLHPLGGTMDPGDVARINRAFGSFEPAAPWPTHASKILPVLKRIWHPYPGALEPFHLQVPPGIPTGFGIDMGPAFSHVTPELIEQWGVDPATLLATALDHLRALVRREPPAVDHFRKDGAEIQVIQGQGWGSALLLLPEVLRPIIGGESRVLLAPVRNTLLAMPETVGTELVVDLWSALADGAHDALDIEPMRWTGTTVVALTDVVTRGLPN